jgi:hypothetical protein
MRLSDCIVCLKSSVYFIFAQYIKFSYKHSHMQTHLIKVKMINWEVECGCGEDTGFIRPQNFFQEISCSLKELYSKVSFTHW